MFVCLREIYKTACLRGGCGQAAGLRGGLGQEADLRDRQLKGRNSGRYLEVFKGMTYSHTSLY